MRKDRNRAGGGVVIYIRDIISFSERNDLVPGGLEMSSKLFRICSESRE